MASAVRRAGAEILRTIARSLDPAAETDKVQLYSKNIGTVAQMFARSPDFPRQISGAECNQIWDRPLTPHAFDDEFESTVLDPAWSTASSAVAWNQGGVDPFVTPATVRYELHTDRRQSWLMMQPPSGAGTTNCILTKNIAFAGDYFMWARGSTNMRVTGTVNNDAGLVVGLSTSPYDGNNRLYITFETNNLDPFVQFVRAVGGVFTTIARTNNIFATGMGLQGIEGFGIQKRTVGGTPTYDGWAFGSSGYALWLGSTTFTPAIGTAFIQTFNVSGAAPGDMITGLDFVRFTESAVFLP